MSFLAIASRPSLPARVCRLPIGLLFLFSYLIQPPLAPAQVEFFEDAKDVSKDQESFSELPAAKVPAPAEIQSIQASFAKAVIALETKTEKRKKTLTENYTKALSRLQEKSSASGDLETAIQIRDVIERVSKGASPGEGYGAKLTNPNLRELHSKYLQAHRALANETAPSLRKLHLTRVDLISSKIKNLTKKGELEAAVAVKGFLESVMRDIPPPPLPSGYDLFYNFDEVAGENGSVLDQSKSGFDATSKAPGWVKGGKRGGGYEIRQGQQALFLDPKPALSEDAFTVSAWVNLEQYGFFARLWDQFALGDKEGFNCSLHNGKPVIELFDARGKNRQCRSTKALELNRWHHLIFTHDSEACAIYVDGEICAEMAVNSISNGNRRVRIGVEREEGKLLLRGTIDDLIHYPRALTGKEALTLFQALSGS